MQGRRNAVRLFTLLAAAGCALPALGDDHPVFLQIFESKWRTMEYRIPDMFMAGYDSVWLPPVCKAGDPTSPGYDAFNRFDLGTPGAETAYGTGEDFRALIDEFHQARVLATVDLIMNHNNGRDGSNGFYNAGGYPGFVLRFNGDLWGDFHDGTKQSTNPGGANYDLYAGDLLALIDIAQEKNHRVIRHPIAAGNPDNIPAGTIRNQPDPNNRRFYPDLQLTPSTFVNSALPVGQQNVTVYPYNLADPMQGDPVLENATELLLRSTQWLAEVYKVDGFRLDAAKHIPASWWRQYWDSAVFNRGKSFGGASVTPFSFCEVVDSNSFAQTYTRKDGFGNRDSLDLNGAGQLRDLMNARGVGSWDNVLFAHLDTVDGGGDTPNTFGNNGSLGVNHIFSHDNGSVGTGGSPPPLPGPSLYALPEHAYLLFRPGPPIVYHNTREFIDLFTSRGFWPREGVPIALGGEGTGTNSDLTELVRLSRGYARGEWFLVNWTDNVNSSRSEVLVFERRRNNGGGNVHGNVVVGVSDSYSPGVAFRSVVVSYPPGTRLHELTGNHADPIIDPTNLISELLTVDANSRILIPVPNNKNVNNVEHHKGYVVYGLATPSGTLDMLDPGGASISSVIAADATSVPSYKRRLTPVKVVTTPTFQIALTTTKTDPSDPDWDDNALFRIDGGLPSAGGFADFNGNGAIDTDESNITLPLYENFLTQKAPLATTVGATSGLYRQSINTAALSEGYHYINVVAFRRRPMDQMNPATFKDPIFTEFRSVIYVDRAPPAFALADPSAPVLTASGTFRVIAADRTTQSVWMLLDVPNGTDPLTLINSGNQATQYDRFEWRKSVPGFTTGQHTLTIVAREISGNTNIQSYPVTSLIGDVNRSGAVDIDDLYAGYAALSLPFDPIYDVDGNGTFNTNDLRALENIIRPTELDRMSKPER